MAHFAKISEDNIKSVRPSYGLHPENYKKLLGRKVKCDLKLGDRLSWNLVD